MMSGVPPKTCSAFNKLWNNKFYYKLHLVGISTEIYYDARIHEHQSNISNMCEVPEHDLET
jgi:copper(I)-binding protein